MSLFSIRKKVDVDTISSVIFEIVDRRMGEIVGLFDEKVDLFSLHFSIMDLWFCTFSINYYLIGNILNHKNDAKITGLVIENLLARLCSSVADSSTQDEADWFKRNFPHALSDIATICGEKNTSEFDNVFSRLSKYITSNVCFDDDYKYDSLLIAELSIIISSWVNDSMFLGEYKIVK